MLGTVDVSRHTRYYSARILAGFCLQHRFIPCRLSPRSAEEPIHEEGAEARDTTPPPSGVAPLPLPDARGLDWTGLVHTASKAFSGEPVN